MRIGDVMTEEVVTAPAHATIGEVATLMRDRSVGSVVIADDAGHPAALITDRDVALLVGADGAKRDDEVRRYVTRPLVCGHVDMDIEEAAALMVQNRVRRLPVLAGEALAGIVTLDDLAVRAGDLSIAQRMTSEVAKAALPEFFFHQRGG